MYWTVDFTLKLLGVKVRYVSAVLCLFALVGCHNPLPEYESRYTAPPPAVDEGIPVAIVGDSYTAGTPVGGSGSKGWPSMSEVQLRTEGIDIYPRIAAAGGAGYVNRSSNSRLRFSDEIQNLAGPDYKLFMVVGSVNDADASPDELTEAVRTAFAEVKAIAPGAKLLVVGPPWLVATAAPGILRARDIVKAEAEAVGATFVDPVAENWLTPDVIGTDGAHPLDAGHEILAAKLTPLLAQQLQT